VKLKPWCSHHLCALQCEPEETDCLRPSGDGWLEVDLSHWWCPDNQKVLKAEAEDEAGEEFNECAWAWTTLTHGH
jgi:hypothetical protein